METLSTPPHTNTYHRWLYKAAIALNNTAVTLTERQQYMDAMNTYRVSIGAIDLAIEEFRNPSKVEKAMSSECISEITRQLHDASQRCARTFIAHNDTDVVTRMRDASYNSAHHGGNLIVVKFSSQQCAISVLETICHAS